MRRGFLLILTMLLSLAAFSQNTYTQSFTAAGSWICPPGVTSISVECWGGGGAGGGTNASVGAGGGGAGGAYSIKSISVTPGTKYYFSPAQAKAGTGNAGSQGDPSWFNQSGANSQPAGIAQGVLAEGGAGGSASGGSSSSSGSKASSFGDNTYKGGNGGAASAGGNLSSSNSGAGGGGSGSTGDGGSASGMTAGTGTSTGGGNGAAGVAYGSNVNGTSCSNTGGGGSGATRNSTTTKSGGAGGPGLVKISFSVCAPLFEQDFSASATVSDYVYTTANETQLDEILSATGTPAVAPAINSGMLRFDGTNGSSKSNFTRSTDFISTLTSAIVKFDISFSSVGTGANQSAIFYLGTGFSTGTSGVPPTATAAHSRLQFATSATSSTGFQIRNSASTNIGPNGTNTTYFTGTQTITYVVNNSGATISYLAPDGTTESVADDKEDIWVGTYRAVNDDGAWGPTKALTDFAFYFLNGAMKIDMDNITINTLASSPSSSAASSAACNSFTANWTTSECSASLEVATNNTFTSMVSGYPKSVTGNSASVTGLSSGTTYYYRLRTSMGSNSNSINSSYSSTQSATTTAASAGGTAASDQAISSGQNPADISVTGMTGSVTKWQSSPDNMFSSPSDIAIASSTLLGSQMGALTQTTYYRAVVQNGTCAAANSSIVTITVAQPLPIELLDFSGRYNGSGNLLKWSTASESNNDYFTIIWSNTGKEFTGIAKIAGAGNSVMKIDYQYLDEHPSRGINYYLLRQTDYDGRYKDSYIISVVSDTQEEPILISRTNLLGQEVPADYKGMLILKYRLGTKEFMQKKESF